MSNANFFLGLPVSFKEKCFIYPPSINDGLANENFSIYKHLLTLSQEEIEDDYIKNNPDAKQLDGLTPLEFLLNNAYHNKKFENLAMQAFEFFIHQPVTFLYEKKAILIGNLRDLLMKQTKLEHLILIEESDYFDFQNLIREALSVDAVEKPNPNEHPRIKAMKAKARYRDKIKAKKGIGVDLQTSLAAICCMNVGLSPLNVGKITFVALRALTNIYQQKEKYELDIDSLLAGADSKRVKPKYWITKINEK